MDQATQDKYNQDVAALTSTRISDMTNNEQALTAMTNECNRFRKIATNWGIDFDVKVTGPVDGKYGLRIEAMHRGKIHALNLSHADVLYWQNDSDGFVNSTCAALSEIFARSIETEISGALRKALNNAISNSSI